MRKFLIILFGVIFAGQFCHYQTSADMNPFNRPTIAVVLSGGGALGSAHVGVLKVLEECRVPVDIVVGNSMGAVVGGGYATGLSPQEIEDILGAQDWNALFNDKPPRENLNFREKRDQYRLLPFEAGLQKGKLTLPPGIVAGQKLDFLLKTIAPKTPVENFDQFPIRFRCVATNLETGESVTLKDGNPVEAIRASMSVGGAFSPVVINNQMLVDGLYTKNLPIDVAQDMGADIVIAVDVGSPLLSGDDLNSFMAIMMQVSSIMGEQNVKRQIAKLGKEDILIKPDLGDLTMMDFDKSLELINMGEKAAKEFVEQFKKYSLSPSEYKKYLESHRRAMQPPIIIESIRIINNSRVSEKAIRARIKSRSGQVFDENIVEKDLTRIYDIGDFEQVNYNLAIEEGKYILEITAQEKNWGPNYLKFGAKLSDDFAGDNFYNLMVQYKRRQLNALGGELTIEGQMGRPAGIATQFYQPLDYAERFFVAPQFFILQDVPDVYDGNDRIARYRVRKLVGGMDLGMNFGTAAELRSGYYYGIASAESIVGDKNLPKFKDKKLAAWFSRFTYDQFDNVYFPKSGIVNYTDLYLSQQFLGAQDTYTKLQFKTAKATTFWKKHTVIVGLEGGTNLGSNIPFYDEFTLGGFSQLSGYRKDQLRGQHFGLGQAVYYYDLLQRSSMLLKGVYVGGSFETGNTWNDFRHVDVTKLHVSGSAFLGLDTLVGPLYVGYAVADGTEEGQFFLFLGRLF